MSGSCLNGLDNIDEMMDVIKNKVNKERPGEGPKMAELYAKLFLQMTGNLRKFIEDDRLKNSVARVLDRDFRILACADSNKAADNLLRLLHNNKDFMAQGYTVVRLGSGAGVDDPELQEYCIDEKIREHAITKVFLDMIDVVKNRDVSKDALPKATEELLAVLDTTQKNLKHDAEHEISCCMKAKLNDLATTIGSIQKEVLDNVQVIVNSKPGSGQKKKALESLKAVLHKRVKHLAKCLLLIPAQVKAWRPDALLLQTMFDPKPVLLKNSYYVPPFRRSLSGHPFPLAS